MVLSYVIKNNDVEVIFEWHALSTEFHEDLPNG
jgi:hypothetical protein